MRQRLLQPSEDHTRGVRRNRAWADGVGAGPSLGLVDDSGDDNADDNPVPAAPCRAPLRRRARTGEDGCVLLGVKWAPALVIEQGARPPPRDRSSDRNEQHRATLEHHPANVVRTRRTGRSGTCMHLLIAGPLALSRRGRRPTCQPCACPLRAPSQGRKGSTAVTHVTCR
jgi:hypothetical protein